MPFDLGRLQRVLHNETGLVFEVSIVGAARDKVRLRLQGVCVHEQSLPVRDELAIAEALPRHFHVEDNRLEDRFFLSKYVADAAKRNHDNLQRVLPETKEVAEVDVEVGELIDQLQLRFARLFFSMSDTEVVTVMRSIGV